MVALVDRQPAAVVVLAVLVVLEIIAPRLMAVLEVGVLVTQLLDQP
jgi:hypothetical protein